jgi:hypothetical protein
MRRHDAQHLAQTVLVLVAPEEQHPPIGEPEVTGRAFILLLYQQGVEMS